MFTEKPLSVTALHCAQKVPQPCISDDTRHRIRGFSLNECPIGMSSSQLDVNYFSHSAFSFHSFKTDFKFDHAPSQEWLSSPPDTEQALRWF